MTLPRLASAALVALALSGCTATQLATAQSTAAAASGPVTTLAALAAQRSTTAADLIAKGALFCRKADGSVAAIATTVGMVGPVVSVLPYGAVAVSVIGASASAVASVCAAIEAIPVPPPTNVAMDTVPVVAVPAAALKTTAP